MLRACVVQISSFFHFCGAKFGRLHHFYLFCITNKIEPIFYAKDSDNKQNEEDGGENNSPV